MAIVLARGDLAIEVGFERLAEIQEQVLWLCEAAHVPVIWATQVVESQAKHGQPTRAEVTDAAWASRAECVMLNRFLDDVFARMHEHQHKRTPLLRRLAVSDALGSLSSSTAG
jgi:pyruvate kinase